MIPSRATGAARRPLLDAFGALLLAQAAGTFLGLGFWVLVARLVDREQVGIAAGAISAQTLVGFLAALGIGTHLVVLLPGEDAASRRRLVTRGLAIAAAAGALAGVVGLLLARTGVLGETLDRGLRGGGAVAFVVGVAAAAAAVVIDEAVLGLGRPRVQVARNLVAAGVRFPLAAVAVGLGSADAAVLQWCWVLPLLGSVGVALVAAGVMRVPAGGAPAVGGLREHIAPALRHHVLTVAVAASTQIVPVVAAVTLTPSDNARFALAWLAATLVFLPPYLLTVALFAGAAAEGRTPEERAARVRDTVRWTLPGALGLSLLLVVSAAVVGGPVMEVFGRDYAADAAHLLALLAPAGLWMVVKDHLVAIWRAEERQGHAARLCACGVLLETAGAAVGAVLDDAEGLALGWLAAILIEAVLFLPALRRAFADRPTPSTPRVSRPRRVWPAAVMVAGVLATAVVVAGIRQPGPAPALWRTPNLDGAQGAVLTGARLQRVDAPCRPSAARPGPRLDLGVQPAVTPRRVLPEREVAGLVARARDAGATVVSTAVSWAAAQPRRGAALDLTPALRVVRAARAAGLEVRVQVLGAPRWAVAEGRGQWRPPVTTSERAAWSGFVATVLRTLPRVDYLEVWTEPDNPRFWPRPDADAYGRLLRDTRAVARRVQPATRLITGGLDGNDTAYLGDLLAWSARSAPGGRLPAGFVGLHPFAGDAPPEEQRLDPAAGFLGYQAIVDQLRASEAVGGRARLYLGEFGYPVGAGGLTDRTRATYARTALGLLTCSPEVAVVSWYYLHPTAYDPPRWTLLDRRLQPGATYRAIADWYASVPAGRKETR